MSVVAQPPNRPTIAITLGDPGGIGPEVTVKALADPGLRNAADIIIFGVESPLLLAARAAGIAPFWTPVPHAAFRREAPRATVTLVTFPEHDRPDPPRRADAASGRASLDFLAAAIAFASRELAPHSPLPAVVTAPICKEAWALAGETRFPGQTELFADAFSVRDFAMMFVSPLLRVILATTHVPLADVPRLLTTELVLRAITLGDAACRRLGVARPRVAVCGLNPHAGEAGLLGSEDANVIAPAIAAARARAIDATGPHPADTIYLAATRGRYDLVVAMYHDQGLIPVKLLHRDNAVNVTVGLPIVRTSPDHGTAFDIAGHNRADPGSMTAAIQLAARLAIAES